jgi:hypothetical protein
MVLPNNSEQQYSYFIDTSKSLTLEIISEALSAFLGIYSIPPSHNQSISISNGRYITLKRKRVPPNCTKYFKIISVDHICGSYLWFKECVFQSRLIDSTGQ